MKICEIFSSVQGEGVLTGTITTFVRTAGCNLECDWCDTPYAQDPEMGEEMTLEEVVREVKACGIKDVCLTGGEPLLQEEAADLVGELVSEGHRVCVETNGTVPVTDLLSIDRDRVLVSMDIKTPSSGMQDRCMLDNIPKLRETDQLKFVLKDEEDMDYAVGILEEQGPNGPRCHVILQPVWSENMAWVAERAVKEDLSRFGVRVLVQLHKVFWGEERGV